MHKLHARLTLLFFPSTPLIVARPVWHDGATDHFAVVMLLGAHGSSGGYRLAAV
jgi:uncharacterized protein involved in response to NO